MSSTKPQVAALPRGADFGRLDPEGYFASALLGRQVRLVESATRP